MFSTKPLRDCDPEIWQAIESEKQRQEDHIELIASENYASPNVLTVAGSVLTNKYAEGYPAKRYYGGCEFVDVAETLAIARAKEQLKDEGRKFNDQIKVGGMIEIPAAAIALPMFLRQLDFLSIGTNDLIQYTLAIDRTDDNVAHLYDPLHPAVLHLVSNVIRQANAAKVPVAVCGEMAGDVNLTRLLLGFGLRDFSMHPANVLTVKQRVLMSSVADIEPAVIKILKADDPDKLRAMVEKLNA